ncbi:MAG: hypothetical protein JJU08_15890 [Rhodobacteraceae bacterium]|nr:hypothetical protein [Paracoccaceae bacterium]
MPASHRFARLSVPGVFAVFFCLIFGAGAAQSDMSPPALPDTVQITLAGYTLTPELTDTGAPVLDDDGAPVMVRVPLDESVVTPGDRVLYVITLDNPTADPALNLSLGASVPAEVVLDPFSFDPAQGVLVQWADAQTPDTFIPLFEEIDAEHVMTADLNALRALRLALPELPPATQMHVEYTVTLR